MTAATEGRERRRVHGSDLVSFAAACALGAAFFLHARFFNDDAWITLRYARHLADGEGLVYNLGERHLGTTTPLWALLMAGLGALGADLGTAATAVGVASLGVAAGAASALLRRRGATPAVQCAAGLLVGTSPVLLLWAGSGMESVPSAALVGVFLLLFEHRRHAALGLVGGLLLLLRPETALVLAAAAALRTAEARSLRPLLSALPGCAAVVLPWVVGAGLYYGSPLPNSGFAKRLQVEDWGTYLAELGRTLEPRGALVAAALVGTVASLRSIGGALPAAALLAVVAGMSLGGLPGCGWYTVVPVYLVAVLGAVGAHEVASRLAALPAGRPLALACCAAPFLAHLSLPRDVHEAKVAQSQIERCHGRVGDWLREHAPDGATVAVDNLGYIGQRSGLRVLDMLGLVQPDVAAAIREGRRDHAIREHRPELVAIWWGRGNTWKYRPEDAWFDEAGYRRVFEAPLWDGRKEPAYVVLSRVPVR